MAQLTSNSRSGERVCLLLVLRPASHSHQYSMFRRSLTIITDSRCSIFIFQHRLCTGRAAAGSARAIDLASTPTGLARVEFKLSPSA